MSFGILFVLRLGTCFIRLEGSKTSQIDRLVRHIQFSGSLILTRRQLEVDAVTYEFRVPYLYVELSVLLSRIFVGHTEDQAVYCELRYPWSDLLELRLDVAFNASSASVLYAYDIDAYPCPRIYLVEDCFIAFLPEPVLRVLNEFLVDVAPEDLFSSFRCSFH